MVRGRGRGQVKPADLLATARQWVGDTLAQQAADEVMDALGDARDARQAKRAEPHKWAIFHRRRWLELPRARFLARAHHKRMARLFASLAWAEDAVLAAKLEIPR